MINEAEFRKVFSRDRDKGFRMLMDYFQKPIYWHIRRMVVSHDDSEDILQEVFIKTYRGLNGFRYDSQLSTWIYRIATNECLRFLEKQREDLANEEEMQEVLLNKLATSEYIDYDNEMAVKFQQALLSLPEKQRVVFNLRYYDELSYEEISKITGTTVEALKTNYHYAKEKIKEYIVNN